MSEVPFDPSTTEQDPAEAFRDAVRAAYLADQELGPYEALGVLQVISAEITASIFESEEDEAEGEEA